MPIRSQPKVGKRITFRGKNVDSNELPSPSNGLQTISRPHPEPAYQNNKPNILHHKFYIRYDRLP